MRSLLILCAIVCAIVASTSVGAQEADKKGLGAARPVALPLEPPVGAPPLIADFVAICTRAVVDPGAAVAEGRARAYQPVGAEGPLANPMADVLRAMAGFTALEKDDVHLTIVRSPFPHMNILSCNMIVAGERPDIDTAVLSSIPGVEGTVLTEGTGRIGRWSVLDLEGEVSLINETSPNDRFWQLSMTRAVRTARGTPQPN